MFGPEFYPTPSHVIEKMLANIDANGKIFLEPSAGKGNIVDALLNTGAKEVLACELEPELRVILNTKCKVIERNFLDLTADKISHIDCIIMNPPFSCAERHILHAYNIAPAGCQIVSLCNSNMLTNAYTKTRQELKEIITTYGSMEDLGDCFGSAERKTGVYVSMISLFKPTVQGQNEFEGFFMDEEPNESGSAGLMPYNFIRDLVQRYITAVEIFDKQILLGIEMSNTTGSFFKSQLCFEITEKGAPKTREDFKKDLQVSGWNFIFSKMRMQKYETAGLREDLNNFIQKQVQIPFTMKNIYRMLEIIVGTHSSRMDKALMEVFEKVTRHYHENRFNVEGWKTNDAYLINKKFIFPYMVEANFDGKMTTRYNSNRNAIEDFEKALCHLTGKNYDNIVTFYSVISRYYSVGGKNHKECKFGEWYDSEFFRFKGFKKGTMHFEFNDLAVWEQFNRKVAQLMGYPLPEKTKEPKKKAEPKPTAEPVKQTATAGQTLALFTV